jgi:N-acetyl sugar amidotransferase
MTKVFWCKNCVVMSTRPRITFNDDGICSACQWMKEKKKLNWKDRELKLKRLLDTHRKNSDFDCIVAVSGGKDGSYVAYNLKKKYDCRVLAVTIRPPLEQEIGKKNLENFFRSGFQHIHITPDENAMIKLNKIGLIDYGHPYLGWLISIHTAVLRVSLNFNIPLIFYSEDGEVEYGGDAKYKDHGIYGIEYQKNVYLEGYYNDILKKSNCDKNQLYWFTYPDDHQLKKNNIQITHWGFYENWDPYRNYEVAKKYCGLQENDTLNKGTYTNFGQTDQKLYFLHVYLMYLKFGFGRTTMDAGIDVRRGAMTRDQAVQLVRIYDNYPPEDYYDLYCDYYKITKEQFLENLDKWANKNLFIKKNRWEPIFNIE